MPGLDGDITVNSLNITGAINHFGIRRAAGVFLHHRVIACQHIAMQVLDAVGVKGEIITRIQQGGVDDRTCRVQEQIARRAGKTVEDDTAPAGRADVPARLQSAAGVHGNLAAGKRSGTTACRKLAVIRQLTRRVRGNAVTLQGGIVGDIPGY